MRPARRTELTLTAIGLLATVFIGACGNTGSFVSTPIEKIAPSAAGLTRAYRLGIGDKLKIQVFGEPDLSGAFEVNAGGTVALPLIGEIPANGRPVGDFRDAMIQRLSQGFLKNPRVTVDITNYRPIYIHGEVRSGGEFAFKNGLKLRDAIALAGGYTYRANQTYVLLTRQGIAQGARVANTAELEVLPGDNIQIPERFF